MNKLIILVGLLLATPALADETYLPLPGDVSIMDLGNITPADLGSVTASDSADTLTLPLPEGELSSEGLEDEAL